MKVCSVCGAKYTDRISFCFNDGAVLEARAVAGGSSGGPAASEPGLDAPVPGGGAFGKRPAFGGGLPSPFDPPTSALDAPSPGGLDAPPLPSAFDAPAPAGFDAPDPGGLDAPAPFGLGASSAADAPAPGADRAAPVPGPDFARAELRPLPLKGAPWKPPAPEPEPEPEPVDVATVEPDDAGASEPEPVALEDDFFDAEPDAEPDAAGAVDAADAPDFDDEPEPRRKGLPIWVLPLAGLAVLGAGTVAVLLVVGVIGGTAIKKQGGADTPDVRASADDVTTEPAAPEPPIDDAPPAPADAPAGEPEAPATDAPTDDPAEPEAADDGAAEPAPDAPVEEPVTDDAVADAAPPAPEPEPEREPDTTAPAVEAAPEPPAPEPPRPTIASMRVVSVPAGARVTVDGTDRGTAPVTVEIPFGKHTVALALDGYQSATRQVDVRTESLQVPVELQPAARTGALMVFMAGRDGDTLFIDGESVGPLPVRTTVTEGEHVFAVEGSQGRFQVSREVVFNASGTSMLNLAAP